MRSLRPQVWYLLISDSWVMKAGLGSWQLICSQLCRTRKTWAPLSLYRHVAKLAHTDLVSWPMTFTGIISSYHSVCFQQTIHFVFPVGAAGSMSDQLHLLWPHSPCSPGLLQHPCLQAALLWTVHGFPLLYTVAYHHRWGHIPVSQRQAAKASCDGDTLMYLSQQVPLCTVPQPCTMGLQALIGLDGHMDSNQKFKIRLFWLKWSQEKKNAVWNVWKPAWESSSSGKGYEEVGIYNAN